MELQEITHYYWCSNLFNELSVLVAIHMGSKGKLLDTASPRDHDLLRLTAWSPASTSGVSRDHGLYLLGLLHNLSSHGAFDTVTCDDHTILVTGCPPLEKLTADTTLQHTGTGQHDSAAHVLETVETFQGSNELEVPWPSLSGTVTSGFSLGHPFLEQALDVVVHGADIGLVHQHTLPG